MAYYVMHVRGMATRESNASFAIDMLLLLSKGKVYPFFDIIGSIIVLLKHLLTR